MATSIRPHTASRTSRHLASSPTRPQTSHSTIRRVTPSPESLSEALESGFAVYSTPRYVNQNRPASTSALSHEAEDVVVRPWTAGISEPRPADPQRPNLTRNVTPTRIPQPTNNVLKTGITLPTSSEVGAGLKRSPAGRISPTKNAAPRKHRPLSTPTPLSSHSEDHVPSISSPLRSAPLPPVMTEKEEEKGKGYKQFTMFPTEDPFITSSNPSFSHPAGSTNDPDRIEAEPHGYPSKIQRKPIPTQISPGQKSSAQRDPHTLTKCARTDRQSSSTSTKNTFSTPGRDEMERKKGSLDEFAADDGPFGRAKDLKGLEERRKRVEVGTKTIKLGKKDKKDGDREGGCGCVVM